MLATSVGFGEGYVELGICIYLCQAEKELVDTLLHLYTLKVYVFGIPSVTSVAFSKLFAVQPKCKGSAVSYLHKYRSFLGAVKLSCKVKHGRTLESADILESEADPTGR